MLRRTTPAPDQKAPTPHNNVSASNRLVLRRERSSTLDAAGSYNRLSQGRHVPNQKLKPVMKQILARPWRPLPLTRIDPIPGSRRDQRHRADAVRESDSW